MVNDVIFEATLAALRRIDDLVGGSPRAHLEQARVFTAWPGHHKQAISRYKQALKLAKQGGDAEQIEGVALAIYEFARTRDYRALHRFALRELVDVDDADYAAWDELGRVTQASPQKNGAEVYLELLEQRPDDRRSHLLYVGFLVRSEQRRAAAHHLVTTLEGGLEDPALWEWLLRLHIQAGRLADARDAYNHLSESFPDAFATRVADVRIALNEGRDALAQLRELTEENPTAELLRMLAISELRAGHLREARRAINKALVRSTPPAPSALRVKARIAGAAQDWNALLEAHRLLLVGGETLSPEEQVTQARALYTTGRAREGRELLLQILNSREAPSGAAFTYAEHEGKRDPKRAHAYLRIAHQRQPVDYDALKALTEFEMRTAPSPRTLARLDQLVANRRATPGALLLRARLLAQEGSYDKAEADVLRAFEAAPSLPGAIDVLFAIYRAQDKLEESRHSFEQAEAAGVLHSGARLLLARFYLNDGDTERARKTLEQVVTDHPEMWSAKQHLAFVLAEQGEDFERALALAREAHARSKGSPETADTIGWVHWKAGRSAAALTEFRRSMVLATAADAVVDPSIHYHLGLTLQALGRSDEAAEAFEQALGRDPDFPEAEDARRQLEAARHPESSSASPS
jgi:tetratricopeptide (TPR) repeat protein